MNEWLVSMRYTGAPSLNFGRSARSFASQVPFTIVPYCPKDYGLFLMQYPAYRAPTETELQSVNGECFECADVALFVYPP